MQRSGRCSAQWSSVIWFSCSMRLWNATAPLCLSLQMKWQRTVYRLRTRCKIWRVCCIRLRSQYAPDSIPDAEVNGEEIRRFAGVLPPEEVQLYYQIVTIG